MRSALWAGCASVFAAVSARAQEGTATWLWAVETDDGDAVVEPGEVAIVTLTVDLDPSIGESDVSAFAGVMFDTLGGANAANGQIVNWEIHNSLDTTTGDLTTTDGVSLFGTVATELLGIGPDVIKDPIDVLSFFWATDDYSGYTVHYSTVSSSFFGDGMPQGFMDVWLEREDNKFEDVQWPAVEAGISFLVVPAPSVVLVMPPLMIVRRRR